MIFGTGVDIVEIVRVAQALGRNGEAFARRVLVPDEWEGYQHAPEPARVLAKRWAMKEAFGKAAGTGIAAPFTFHAMTVMHDERGAPHLMLSDAARVALAGQGAHRWHISVSDERDYVVAFAIIEKQIG